MQGYKKNKERTQCGCSVLACDYRYIELITATFSSLLSFNKIKFKFQSRRTDMFCIKFLCTCVTTTLTVFTLLIVPGNHKTRYSYKDTKSMIQTKCDIGPYSVLNVICVLVLTITRHTFCFYSHLMSFIQLW